MPGVGQVGIYPWSRPMPHTHQNVNQGGQIDHGLANLGLADDDHGRYYDKDATKDLQGLLDLEHQDVTINAGNITINRSLLRIGTEGGAATDNLDTINPGDEGQCIFLKARYNDQTVVIREVGNIVNPGLGNITLDTYTDYLLYLFNAFITKWILVGYTNFLSKARIDALNINADQVDGEEAANIVTNARVKAHFPDTIANILSNHTKAIHDALRIEELGAATEIISIADGDPSLCLREVASTRGTFWYDTTNHILYLQAGSEDADLCLVPHGTGKVKFGTHAAIGAETVTGFIIIKDSVGNARKLAIVS